MTKRVFANTALLLITLVMVFLMGEGFFRVEKKFGPFRFVGMSSEILEEIGEIPPNPPLEKGGTGRGSFTKGGISTPFTLIPLSQEAKIEMQKREGYTLLPEEWKEEKIPVKGGRPTIRWHGILHHQDENGFRRIHAFPEKKPNTFRVMVVGDSLTYGYGIEEKFTFTALLQHALEKNYHIEFLNLGKNGAQSEDVLKIIQHFLPQLKPDLIVYGVCQNDFLPSGKGQYTDRVTFKLLPRKIPDFLTQHFLFAQFVNDRYLKLLRKYGLTQDFYDDILNDFSNYQQRFARDLKQMNEFITAQGLPPMIAMVLDQFPNHGNQSKGYRITQIAEQKMKEAGIQVIETENYYQTFHGKLMNVSAFEGHPNEEANAIFASMFLNQFKESQALAVLLSQFKKQ